VYNRDVRTLQLLLIFIALAVAGALFPRPIYAAEVLGVHILNPGELSDAASLLKSADTRDNWDYVTIPISLNELSKKDEWVRFFLEAKDKKFQPIIRLATRVENSTWITPTRKDIIDLTRFLSALPWPNPDERIIVVFNEPNHAAEWGNTLDPEGYGNILQFTADWLHSENAGYVVLPAGLDLAAPNANHTTMEAFAFLRTMLAANPGVLDVLDGWTSHSYPNPAFSASPLAKGKTSLRGYEYELEFLRGYTNRQFPVYITETGWVDTPATGRWLSQYYKYAVTYIWSDPRIRAVTPFVLRGAPGAFTLFSFLDAQGKPTRQFDAFQKAMEK